MARTKGTKNRSTLEKELRERGDTSDLSKLSRDEIQARLTKTSEPPPPAPPPPPKPLLPADIAQPIIEDARRRFEKMISFYTSEDDIVAVPERIQDFLRKAVYEAESIGQATQQAFKALAKLHIHLLRLWANREISGPSDDRNLETRAKKADAWAKRLESLGRTDDAAKQRARAEAIRNTPRGPGGTPWMD